MGNGTKTTIIIVVIQTLITLIIGALSLWIYDTQIAGSALLGGAICIIATLCFSIRVFSGGVVSAKTVANKIFVGEIQKIALTAVLFFIVIKWTDFVILPLLITFFIANFVSYWLALPLSSAVEARTQTTN